MITCLVTSPKGTKTYKGVLSLDLRSPKGRLQILSGHAESFFVLEEGSKVKIRMGDKSWQEVEVGRVGECYVKNNKAIIIL